MRFIHSITGELRKYKTACPVASETSKRGSGVEFKYPVQFVDENAVVIELDAASTEVVTLGFKAPAGYNSVAFVAGPFTAVKSGTGAATVYTFTITFATALVDQLLATNLDDAELVPEIKWASPNYKGETLAFDWIVQNNVNRGGETVSSYPVTAIATTLPAITRLVGGTEFDLDKQELAGFPDNTVFEVVTDLDGAGTLGESRWQKRAGAELVSDVAAGVIVCSDGTHIYRVAG
jgi:hypothetical protein